MQDLTFRQVDMKMIKTVVLKNASFTNTRKIGSHLGFVVAMGKAQER